MLQQIVHQISATNPALMNIIENNQAQFLELLNNAAPSQAAPGADPIVPAGINPAASGGGAAAAAGNRAGGTQRIAIPVSPEDNEALQRLKALGFPESLVIEAYFACDKNEDLAANYILQRMDEFNQDQAD